MKVVFDMLKLTYPACFYPNENNGYTVVVPDLPGCVTCGSNLADAMEMAVDASSGWILDELEDGKSVPKASDINDISADEHPNGFTSMLFLDMDSYSEKNGDKAIRKNCTLPAWLCTRAEKEGVNFSQVLQEALIEKLNICSGT